MEEIVLTKKDISIKAGIYKIYNCPRCKKNYILNIHNYCPICGIKIIFGVDVDE